MGVVERQERAVLVVVHQRRVERAAAEHAGADEIPERGADDVGVGEPVFELAMRLDQPVMLDRLDDQQHQRQHLDEGEHGAERHPHARAAGPVEMMAGAEHAAEEDQDQLEIDRALGELARHQADRHQQIGADRRGEELEGLLDPEMDHPPAPEIGDGEGLLDAGERDHAEDVEQRDIDGGGPDQMLEPDAAGPELPRGAATKRGPLGHSARKTSRLQITSPAKKPICQKRPSWM